jgi:transposase-like protein
MSIENTIIGFAIPLIIFVIYSLVQFLKSKTDDRESLSTVAFSVGDDDMHFTVECPHCYKEEEYKGWFDSGEEFECRYCNATFFATKLIMSNGDEIL